MSGLENFYRSKEIYIKLPTNGKYYTQLPKFNNDGELGIMPLTARDEMLLKVPDTLYNGEALFEVVKSVAPDIADPFEVLIPDLDAILVATRIASYGKDMEVSATCPHCNESTEYNIDLTNVISKLKTIEELEVEINGLTIELKPNSIASINAKSIANVESQRIIAAMKKNENNLELYQAQFKHSLDTITAANIAVLANRIKSIKTPNGDVITDVAEIVKWLTNTTSTVNDQLSKLSEPMNSSGILKEFKFECSNESCKKEFTSFFEFNPAFFFKSN